MVATDGMNVAGVDAVPEAPRRPAGSRQGRPARIFFAALGFFVDALIQVKVNGPGLDVDPLSLPLHC